MTDGFVRLAAKSPRVTVADPNENLKAIKLAVDEASKDGASLLVLPELCISAYSCDDLFNQTLLLERSQQALMSLVNYTGGKELVVVAGFPLENQGKLYNCAAVMANGELLGVVPKSNIPTYTEFYEKRHFAPAPAENAECLICGEYYPFGSKLLFRCAELPQFVLGVEICEDVFVTSPPSGLLSLAGATVIANPSASDELVCKPDYRRMIVCAQSAKNTGAYVYCNAAASESTNDVVFSAHDMIAENGVLLAQSLPFAQGSCTADVDLQRIVNERARMTSVREDVSAAVDVIEFSLEPRTLELRREVSLAPFIPSDERERAQRCEDIFNIQCYGLSKRMEAAHCRKALIGVSGGLDSTLALLVCERTFKMTGRDMKDIVCISMPCFGTTERTKSNAQTMCERLGVDFRIIDIKKSVEQHLSDMGHNGSDADVAYENAQARERTQLLMDIANLENGMVIGTGDLSELALGWCTYNGDHMSMYSVNCSIPKTLVRHLVRFAADKSEDEALRATLFDVLDTPVSPELLPSDGSEMVQRTEDIIGPYELHDFFLYYAVRWGFSPRKIKRLALKAFEGSYDEKTIDKWLREFYKRFFRSQFKRTCVPNGPKVGSVSLSPRGDWRMPSDASAELWLRELD